MGENHRRMGEVENVALQTAGKPQRECDCEVRNDAKGTGRSLTDGIDIHHGGSCCQLSLW